MSRGRPQRVADQIQRELSVLLSRELRDPRLALVTLTAVDVAPDLSHALVYFTCLEAAQVEPAAAALQRAAGYLRSQLAKRIKLYTTPELRFRHDESVARGAHLSQLIDSVRPEELMRRRLDGVLLLDKPAGVGSNALLQAVKRLYAAAKAGHAGTLDPLASGLLLVLFGEATKFSQFALDADKEYMARARLGVTTTTADAEGEVLERSPCTVREADIEPVLAAFRGDLEQVPPMYSALKHAGRPLYALAREGREIPRAARRIRVHELQLVRFAGDDLELRVLCSKGTYIRTLVEDIGRALGCGAHLASLRRTRSGGFCIEDAVTPDQLQSDAAEARDARLLPLERLLAGLPRVDLAAAQAERFARGQALRMEQAPAGQCSVYGLQGRLLGLGEGRAPGELRPRRLVSNASG